MSVLDFPTLNPPPLLRESLAKGHWKKIVSGLENGLNPLMPIDNIPLYASILKHWAQQNIETDFNIKPLTPELKKSWKAVSPDTHQEKTALCWAVYFGQWGLALELLKEGCSVDTTSWSLWEALLFGGMERFPLHEMCITQLSGNEIQLKVVSSEAQLNHPHGVFKIMQLAKEKTTSWPQTMHSSSSPFLLSIVMHQHQALEGFLNIGISPNIVIHPRSDPTDKQGFFFDHLFPIQVAIETGNHVALNMLLQAGADPSVPLQNNFSALDCAIITKQKLCLEVLLSKVPQSTLQKMLPFAIIYAVAENDFDAVVCLLDAGASVHTKTASGYNLLHQAAMTADKLMVDFLMQNGLELSAPAENGVRPFDLMKIHNPELAKRFPLGESSNVISLSFHKAQK